MILLAAATAWTAVAATTAASAQSADDGFDDRGVDRHDRTPDWSYRRGEPAGKGAYYDGGRYGPRGLLRDDVALMGRSASARDATRANRRFAKIADRNRDGRLTDAEIGVALATASRRAR